MLNFGQPRIERFINDPLHNPFGRVIDAVPLTFAEFVYRGAAVRLGFKDFEFCDRLLEDAPERIEPKGLPRVAIKRPNPFGPPEIGCIVVRRAEIEERFLIGVESRLIASLQMLAEDRVGHVQPLKLFVFGE